MRGAALRIRAALLTPAGARHHVNANSGRGYLHMMRLFVVLAAWLGCCATVQAQQFTTPAEERFSPYYERLPACDKFLGGRPNQRPLPGEGIELLELDADDRGLRSIPRDRLSRQWRVLYSRRYCIARAAMSDKKERTVIYEIQEDLGIIGWGYGVEWCVIGLDRNSAYSPACSALRPYAERFLGDKASRVGYRVDRRVRGLRDALGKTRRGSGPGARRGRRRAPRQRPRTSSRPAISTITC